MSMLASLCGLFVVLYLPGAALFRVPRLDRDRRAGLDAEERVFWAVLLSLAWSTAVVLALAAFGHYTLGRLMAIDGALAGGLAATFRRNLLLGTARRRATRSCWLPLALVVLGACLFFPPFEHLMGGKDPGVYVSEGIQIAQHGSLAIRDTTVASLPATMRDLFFPSHHVPEYYGVRFMGFFVLDPDSGTVVGQFPHLYPACIAIAYGLSGVRGALATTPVIAILGLLAVYFAGVRLLGRWPALLAGVLLALNVAETWFARDPNSEVVAQAILFGGFLAFARAQVDGDRFFAPIAGVLFGLSLFLRIDAVLALAAVTIAIVFQLLEGRRPGAAFLAPLAGTILLAAIYLLTFMRPYLARPLIFVSNLRLLHLVLIAVGGAGVAMAIAASRIERIAVPLRRQLPRAIGLTVAIAACYAYFLRMPGGRLAWHDARSLEAFTWYFPPLALAAAVVGYNIVTWRSFSRAPALLVALAVYGFFVFYKLQIVPDHFWVARRFVPVILPGACLMFAAAVSALLSAGGRKLLLVSAPLAAVLVLLVSVPVVRADARIIGHVEYRGMAGHLTALAQRFGKNDLVVVESRNTGLDMHVLAQPLAYIYGQPLLVLDSPKPDKQLFRQFIGWARDHYANVYFLGAGGTDLVSRSIGVVPVAGGRIEVPEYESARNAYPHEVRQKKFPYAIYRVSDASAAPGPFAIDVGGFDDLNVLRFYAKEEVSGVPFRWSGRSSFIAVPAIGHAERVTLWLSDGGRPKTAAPAQVTVYLDGRLLGTARVASTDFQVYSFAIPPQVNTQAADPDEASLLQITTNTWNPRQQLNAADDRDLGVMVRRVEVR